MRTNQENIKEIKAYAETHVILYIMLFVLALYFIGLSLEYYKLALVGIFLMCLSNTCLIQARYWDTKKYIYKLNKVKK